MEDSKTVMTVDELTTLVSEAVKTAQAETVNTDVDALVRERLSQRTGADSIRRVFAEPKIGASGFRNFSDFLKTVKYASKGQADNRLQLPSQKALGEGADAAGGYLVPDEFMAVLLRNSLGENPFMSRARIIPMSRETKKIPTVNETTHSGSVYGGINFTWTAESETKTETEPVFGQLTLHARKLAGICYISDELLEDSAIGQDVLLSLFKEAMMWQLEGVFLNGDGVGKPLGVLNCAATVAQASEPGQPAGTIVAENIFNMYARLLPSSKARAIWLASPDAFPQLASMNVAVGAGGSVVWLSNNSLISDAPGTLYGRPVFISEHCSTVGTVGDLMLVDPREYLIGLRKLAQVDVSQHVHWAKDESCFRILSRVDGQCSMPSSIVPANGGATLSPFVTLATR